MRFTAVALAAAMSVGVVSAIDLISIKGRHFYNSVSGDPFFVSSLAVFFYVVGCLFG